MENLRSIYDSHTRRFYIPICTNAFLCIISPLVAIIYGFTGFKIEKLSQENIDRIEVKENMGNTPFEDGMEHTSGL
jgi:NhaC family Na+:H+ antiporter